MNETIREFLLETNENLAQLDLDLVTLEKDPREKATLGRVFRTLHTVKGTAGFLGLPKLQAVAHAAETLLSRLRAGELTFGPEIATALLSVVDAIRTILAGLEATETEGPTEHGAVIQTLERLTRGGGTTAPPLPPAVVPLVPPPVPAPQSKSPLPAFPPTIVSDSALLRGRLDPVAPLEGTAPSETALPALPPPPPAPQVPPPATPPAPLAIPPSPPTPPPAPPAPPQVAPPARAPQTAPPARVPEGAILIPKAEGEPLVEARTPAVADTSLRVDVGLLDKLMTLVGELVLARNQILQFSHTQEDAPFLGTVQRLNQLTTELQAGVMKTRMQPIGNVWGKFPRLVRDIAVACEKQVRLDMDGQDTELDKTIIEAIRDPLTHMVRNAIDHGIERPADRVAAGKPAEGRLLVHAAHEGGKVVIEISDDGGGIDPRRVRDKAIANQIVTTEHAARMTDRELLNLIFLPGFSTAEKVTHFSGRGVGMDVVRTNIEKIGGTVDVESRPGHGTAVKMKIPLTLAIIPALTVTSGGDRYAIPQVSLLELVRLDGECALKGIERIHGAPVYRLRGNLLPVIYLHEQLQVEAARPPGGEINVVVLQAEDRPFGLVVDDIHDTEEIVVKPLQKQLKGVPVFSGATIMGDGKVALILDVLGLAQRAGVLSGGRERARTDKATSLSSISGERQTVLLVAAPGGRRMAVALSQVARLEMFPRSAIEGTGGRVVVQYRDEIMPLVRVSRALGRRAKSRKRTRARARKQGAVPVVVYAGAGRRIGLVVGRILDILETAVGTRSPADQPGVLFTAVVQNRVTEFLDIDGIIRAAAPELFGAAPTARWEGQP